MGSFLLYNIKEIELILVEQTLDILEITDVLVM